MPELETEKVTGNYQPAPGQMGTRTFWIAYPPHVADYGHVDDRIARAAGRARPGRPHWKTPPGRPEPHTRSSDTAGRVVSIGPGMAR
jgi:hypothetical protein